MVVVQGNSAIGSGAQVQSQRKLLLVCGGLLLGLLLSLALAGRMVRGSFATIERQQALRETAQLGQAFNSDLRQLVVSTRNYARWDDAANFVATGDRTFISSNFTEDALREMHVDVVWMADANGREVYSGFYDRGQGTLASPAPPALLGQFAKAMHEDARLRGLAASQRLVRTSRGLAAFSVEQVRHSDGTQPNGAILMFARFFYDEDLERVRQTYDQPLSYTYLPSLLTSAATADLPPEVRAWINTPGLDPVYVGEPTRDLITGYALMRDIEGLPAALFTTTESRDAYRLGVRATYLMLAGIALLMLLASACVLWLVIRLRNSFAAAQAAESRYSRIAAQLTEAITIVEADTGRIIAANETVQRALGCTPDSIRSRTAFDLYPDLRTDALVEAAHSGVRQMHASRMRGEHGTTFDCEISMTRLPDELHSQLCLVGHDVSHRKAAEEQQRSSQRQLVHMAQHDPLTGLPNRLFLRSRLPRALRHSAASGKLLALIYLDIDHFKNINDSRGHGVGDQLLQVVAKRLRAAVAAQDVVVRMGGDEFVIVGALLPDDEAVENLALRIESAIQAPLQIDDAPLEVSASMGIAIHGRHGLEMESLLKHADIALYEAKAAGRRCHRVFSQDMVVRVSETVALEQALRRAVGTNQLSMDYQPVIDLRTGQVSSLEALMRWRHPELGLVPPSQFIPVADGCGLTVEFGNMALRDVMSQLRTWQDEQVPLVPIAVNVSPVQLEQGGFDRHVMAMAKEHGIDPRWLRFEITESALLKNPEGLVETLQTLRSMGSQVLIDDFGTGYSGLSYLTRMPIDALKIDRSFVSDLGRSTARTPIIGAVIDMARRLELSTVAEGVETAEQAALLRDLGCDYAQGYHFSRPVSARNCKALLEHLGRERPITETIVHRALGG
jgi:diguanylate cyclase (GGDEF)-like protein/PAS domain S-box-containing protein